MQSLREACSRASSEQGLGPLVNLLLSHTLTTVLAAVPVITVMVTPPAVDQAIVMSTVHWDTIGGTTGVSARLIKLG